MGKGSPVPTALAEKAELAATFLVEKFRQVTGRRGQVALGLDAPEDPCLNRKAWSPLLAAVRLEVLVAKLGGLMGGDRGVAASLFGRPSLCRDVDVLVALHERRWPGPLRSGATQGFGPRQAAALELAHNSLMRELHHHHSGLAVLQFSDSLPVEREALARAIWVDLGEGQLPRLSP